MRREQKIFRVFFPLIEFKTHSRKLTTESTSHPSDKVHHRYNSFIAHARIHESIKTTQKSHATQQRLSFFLNWFSTDGCFNV